MAKIIDTLENHIDIVEAAKDLVYYCDSIYNILSESGYPGTAEALESRYLKLGNLLGLEPDNKDIIMKKIKHST